MSAIVKNRLRRLFRSGKTPVAFLALVSISLSLYSSPSCLAHGELDKMIQNVCIEILENPDSSLLYVKRARLYFQHKEYEESIDDLKSAQTGGLDNVEIDLLLARNHQQLGAFDPALQYIEKIEASGNHVLSMKTKAEILYSSQRFQASARCYENLIDASKKALPHNYLSAAKAWEGLKTELGNSRALAIINRGISDLGELFVFNKAKVEHYVQRNQYREALVIQDIIIQNAARKEMALFEAAKIAALIPDASLVLFYLDAAEAAIQKIPAHKRQIAAVKDLQEAIDHLKVQQN